MRRLFWLAAGAAAGVVAVRQANRVLHRLTPSGAARSAAGGFHRLGDRARAFADDVRIGMAEREAEIARALEESVAADEALRDDPRQPGRFDTTDTTR